MMVLASIDVRFWRHVKRGSDSECWVWTGQTVGRYGRMRSSDGERLVPAHRVAYELLVGPIPSGLRVLHRCDNPPCCNPAHLLVGTQAENMNDMRTKGRAASGDRSGARLHPERIARGEAQGHAKLSNAMVREIRSLTASGLNQRVIAKLFGVAQPTVSDISTGRTWRHVEEGQ